MKYMKLFEEYSLVKVAKFLGFWSTRSTKALSL